MKCRIWHYRRMKDKGSMNRRRFVQAALGASALATVSGLPNSLLADVTKPQRDPFDGLKLGMASYTLRKFSLDEAIAMTKQARVKYITLKDMHLPMNSTRKERQEAHKKIEDAGLVLMGGGVIYMKNDPEQIRAAFDYAKEAGMPTIVCSPDVEALDTVEKMAREYNILIAIHNHGPGDKQYPSPLDVLRLVENRDKRMGVCMDVGHTVRIGQDPVEAIEQCGSRLHDFHMKDENAATPKGSATEVGRGVIDIVGVLKALIKLRFPYHVALEYEAHAEAPMPGIIESYGYIRGVCAAI